MTYTVEFTAASARELRKLDPTARNRVLSAVARLESDPRPGGARRLVGFTDAWRLRVGDYRVLYEVVDDTVLATVFRVGQCRGVDTH